MGQCIQCLKICFLPANEPLLDGNNPKAFSFEASRLAKAASRGDLETVQNLLVECTTISINEKDEYGSTALYRAVEKNHLLVAKLLLDLKASPNELTKVGKSCLHAAVENGSYEMCELLLKYGSPIDVMLPETLSTPLHEAISRGYTDICQLLLQFGADINVPKTSNQTFYYKRKPLSHHRSLSTMSNSSEAPQIVPSPIYLACSLGHTEIVSLLIGKGASIYERDTTSGLSCLMTACENGHSETVYFLLTQSEELSDEERSKYINEPCELCQNWSPLHFAASQGHTQVVSTLCRFAVNLNCVDTLGRTPLHYASLRGHPSVVAVLIEAGADITIKDDDGKGALDMATETIQYYNIQTQFKRSLKKRSEVEKLGQQGIPFTIPTYFPHVSENITSSPLSNVNKNDHL
ncbi:hypothetical protein ABK040_009750 [Willaertia magna]